MSMTDDPLLSIRDLTVDFGSDAAVRGVSLDIHPGERYALVGESGSGKTVTALSVLQLNQNARYGGSIRFYDTEARASANLLSYSEREMRRIRGRQIAMVFQEPMTALNALYTVGNQIVESIQLHEGVSYRVAAGRAIELLDRTGVPEPQRRFHSYPHQLSGGQRQRAMIAMALACRPRLLIADEPTTALDVTIRAQILALLAELQQEFGMAVLLITHDLNMVLRFAQRVGVMSRGVIVETAPTAELFARPQHDYTRVLLNSRPAREVCDLPADAPELVSAHDLTCTFHMKRGWFRRDAFHAVRGVALDVRRGETVGIVGESGSGKTTLGLALLRLQPCHGTIRLNGQPVDRLTQGDFRPLRKNLQVVFQDPYSSLSPRRTVEQIVGEGLALHFPEHDGPRRRSLVIDILQQVGLDASVLGRYPHEFSGGQRQRIAIARAAVLRPQLLVLDEPTSALDATVQQQVLRLLVELQQKLGMSYLFISHDLAVIQAIAHRVIVMKDGEVVERGDTARILQHPRHPYTRRLIEAAL
jgi:microcin C transport system ATP-binding protein